MIIRQPYNNAQWPLEIDWSKIPQRDKLDMFVVAQGRRAIDLMGRHTLTPASGLIGSKQNRADWQNTYSGWTISPAFTVPGRSTGANNGYWTVVSDAAITSSTAAGALFNPAGAAGLCHTDGSRYFISSHSTSLIAAGDAITCPNDGTTWAIASKNFNNKYIRVANAGAITFSAARGDGWGNVTQTLLHYDSSYPTSNYSYGSMSFFAAWSNGALSEEELKAITRLNLAQLTRPKIRRIYPFLQAASGGDGTDMPWQTQWWWPERNYEVVGY